MVRAAGRGGIARARQRAWIEFASASLDNIGALYNASRSDNFERVTGKLDAKWQQLEDALPESGYFAGEDFSLVDAAFAPVFRYIDLFEQLADRDFLVGFQRIGEWRRLLARRESVVKAVARDYPTLLLEFIGKRNSWLGERARGLLTKQFAA
jgi:glutathione S-transferase